MALSWGLKMVEQEKQEGANPAGRLDMLKALLFPKE